MSRYSALLETAILPFGDVLVGQRMMARLRFLRQAQWWDPERLEAERTRRLESSSPSPTARFPSIDPSTGRCQLRPTSGHYPSPQRPHYAQAILSLRPDTQVSGFMRAAPRVQPASISASEKMTRQQDGTGPPFSLLWSGQVGSSASLTSRPE